MIARYWRVSTLALLTCAALYGQAVSGNIAGTVQDSTGAAIPDAVITITDLDRGTVYNLKSSSDGNFSQTHLLAGHYQVKITSAGLGVFTANATVEVDATRRLMSSFRPLTCRPVWK